MQWGVRENIIVISDSVRKFTYGSNNILDIGTALDISIKRLKSWVSEY